MSDLTEVPDLMGKLDAAIAVVRADEREKALADAKARIEELVHKEQGFDNADMEYGYGRGLAESIRALAALNQPQTEKMCRVCRNVGPPGYNCSECDGGGAATEKCPEDCDGFGQLIGDSDGPCPACSGLESDGGGAATAAGVADADLVRVGDFFGLPAFTHPDVKPGIVGIVSLAEWERRTGTAPQRPKADPKEVHSCHADCPCQSGGEPLRDFVAPVPHTEGEKACPDCGGPLLVGKIESAELVCPFCSGTGKEKA